MNEIEFEKFWQNTVTGIKEHMSKEYADKFFEIERIAKDISRIAWVAGGIDALEEMEDRTRRLHT